MNETLKNWLTAIVAIAALTGIGYLLDGPSAAEVEAAQAADLADAQRHAALMADMTRICTEMRGPGAELLQIEGSSDYVCREGVVEPTPVEILHRYAQLRVKQ